MLGNAHVLVPPGYGGLSRDAPDQHAIPQTGRLSTNRSDCMRKHNLWLGGWYNYALSLSGPSACVVPARLLYDCCHVTNSYVFCFPLIPPASGQRLNFIIKFCSVLFCSQTVDAYFIVGISGPDRIS